MKSTTVIISLLASVALAQPRHGHNHQKKDHGHHNKRALVTEWVTETVYETVTKVIDATTTQVIVPPKATSTLITSVSQAHSSAAPVVPVVPASSPKVEAPPPAPETTSSSQAAPPVQTVAPAPPSPPPPVESSSAPAPVVQPAAATVASPPAVETAKTESSSSTSGSHSGDLTYYDVGLGACGFDDVGLDMSENIVALSHEMMGIQSNGNPYCNRKVIIKANGKTVTATVRDKCMGCAFNDIDVSKKAFVDVFGALTDGRKKVEWAFSD